MLADSVLTVSENTGESERSRNNAKLNDERKWCDHNGLHWNRGGEAAGGL